MKVTTKTLPTEQQALEWLKQNADRLTPDHAPALIELANRLLGSVPAPPLRMPEGLTETGQQAHAIILAYLQQHNLRGSADSRAFYSPNEWRARNEEYGTRGHLIIVYDGGGDIRPVFSMDAAHAQGTYTLYEGLQEKLHAADLYFEECTHWYGAVYSIQ